MAVARADRVHHHPVAAMAVATWEMVVDVVVMAPIKDHGLVPVLVLAVIQATVQTPAIVQVPQHLQVLVQEQPADTIQAPMVYQQVVV
jgi:hypothetical protein